MRKLFLYIFCSLFLVPYLKAQDIHFSQFYESPILLNPAAAGAGSSDYRLAINYRNQWKSVINPFKTGVIAFDTKLFNRDKKNYLGLGASIFNDQAGISKLTTNQANLDLAYHIGIDPNNRFSIGAKAGFFQKYVNASGLRWDNQYNGVDYDGSRPTGETISGNRYSNLDLGAGLVYTYLKPEKGLQVQGGFSAMHLTRPKNSFAAKDENTNLKYTAHVSMEIRPKEKKYAILPSLLFAQQSSHHEITGGGNFAFLSNSKLYSAIYIGAFYRYKDAAIAVAGLEYKKCMKFSVSYDFNVSKFNTASRFRGGPEFCFVYTGFRKEKKKPELDTTPVKPAVAIYSGGVYGDGKPINAEISILPLKNDSASGPDHSAERKMNSDPATGKYTAELEGGKKYKVKINSPGFEAYEEVVDLTSLKEYAENQKDFNLSSKSAVYTGSVTSNGKPVGAKITYVPLSADGQPLAEMNEIIADPVNGNYRSQLKGGKKYKVKVEAPSYQTIESEIDLLTLKDVNEQKVDFDLKPVKAESPCSEQLPDVSSIKGKSLRDPAVYAKMLDLFSNWCMENVIFKVQVSAYPVSRASEYKHKYLDDLGSIEQTNYPDGLTRFTLDKQFNSIKDVEALRQKAIGHGQKDSWITVFVNGKRVTLEDFIGH
jgi:type IX secretion system PorP/SprF family membrane protein